MSTLRHRSLLLVACALVALAILTAAAPRAAAKTYTDVPKTHWAYSSIKAVTDRGPAGHKVLDDYGKIFKPGRAIARSQLARALVIAAGRHGESYNPVAIGDVGARHRYHDYIQIALKHKYLSLNKQGDFLPAGSVSSAQAEVAIVRWVKERYPSYSWRLLANLSPSRWQPNQGWKTGAPSYLPSIIASRQLQLRVNHSSANDGREVTPGQPITRAAVASMFKRGYDAGASWRLQGLADYANVTFPALSARQKQIVSFSLKYVGYPYIWGGEYPTKNSPYGYQKAGGFDCSGFAFYVMKMKFGYPISVSERGGSAMAAKAKPRITRGKLTAGDLIFFGSNGTSSTVASIYHVGLYVGNGWFIHSTGSSDGVTLSSLNKSTYWKSHYAWGRRLLTRSELALQSTSVGEPAPWSVTLALSGSQVAVNDTVTYSGSVRSAGEKAGKGVVTIQKRLAAGGPWIAWRTATLDATGKYSLAVKMTNRQAWQFRARMPGDSFDLTGYSPLEGLMVGEPAAWSVTLALSGSQVAVNDTVTYSGSVRSAGEKAGKGVVTIQKRLAAGGPWIAWRTATLDATGKYSLAVKMTNRQAWQFRARMPGDSFDLTGYSPLEGLMVGEPAPWSVTLALSGSQVAVNDTVTYSGSVRSAGEKAGKGVVTIQKRLAAGGPWIAWRTATLDATGKYSLAVKMTNRQAWQFRARMPGDSFDLTGYSPLEGLMVGEPAAVVSLSAAA